MVFQVKLTTAEDGWIVAECPALPGCVSQGKDQQEALANIKRSDFRVAVGRGSKGSAKCQGRRARDSGNRVVAWRVWRTFPAKRQSELLKKPSWQQVGQVGSHVVLSKPGLRVNLSIPQHKELSIGTLRALIRHAGMTVEEFLSRL